MRWYQPDERWEIWGIKNQEEYVEKYVVLGKFHNNVPRDVVEAFETVTYLMAHAYFYYPIYDEAMSKALLIMEMAIKIKAEELQINLKEPPTKKGIVYDKKLYRIIEEVCSHDYLKFLEPEFNRSKKMRNTKMHPKEHTIMGAMGFTQGNAMLFVNVINKFFMPENELRFNSATYFDLSKPLLKFKQGLFVVERNSAKFLITSIFDFKYLKHLKKEILLLYVQPILLNAKKSIENHNYVPLILALNQFEIKGHSISGVDTDNNNIKIYANKKKENIFTWKKFIEDYNKINRSDLNQFHVQSSRMALWRYEELIYENCWD